MMFVVYAPYNETATVWWHVFCPSSPEGVIEGLAREDGTSVFMIPPTSWDN